MNLNVARKYCKKANYARTAKILINIFSFFLILPKKSFFKSYHLWSNLGTGSQRPNSSIYVIKFVLWYLQVKLINVVAITGTEVRKIHTMLTEL